MKLSIIIPCYNCEQTLRETVESCYTQGFSDNEFEIIMVDDGSTDKTQQLMQQLGEEHQNISLLSHKKNRGGGSARNTGVKAAEADVCICFDSDDVLGEQALNCMYNTLVEKKLDGIVFGYTRSFKHNVKNSKKNNLYRPDTAFTFADIFSGNDWGVGANFMFTKSAWETIGGYPTHHSFDTQGFGVRFLGHQLTAENCADAFFYHRQFGSGISYFERAYAQGTFSLNYFLCFFEYIDLFSEEIQSLILQYNIFHQNSIIKESLQKTLVRRYQENPKTFLAHKSQQSNTSILLATAAAFWRNAEFSSARDVLIKIKREMPAATNIDYLFLFSSLTEMYGTITVSQIDELLCSYTTQKYSPDILRNKLLKRVFRKLKSFVK